MQEAIKKRQFNILQELQRQIPIPEFQKCLTAYAKRYNGSSSPCLVTIERLKALVGIEHLFHAFYQKETIDPALLKPLGAQVELLWGILGHILESEFSDEMLRTAFCELDFADLHVILPSQKVTALRALKSELQFRWEMPFSTIPELDLRCEKEFIDFELPVRSWSEESFAALMQELDLHFLKPLPSLQNLPTDESAQFDFLTAWEEDLDCIICHSLNQEHRNTASKIKEELLQAKTSPQTLRAFFHGDEIKRLLKESNALIDTFNVLEKELKRQNLKTLIIGK
jgi:hypothetical protein